MYVHTYVFETKITVCLPACLSVRRPSALWFWGFRITVSQGRAGWGGAGQGRAGRRAGAGQQGRAQGSRAGRRAHFKGSL